MAASTTQQVEIILNDQVEWKLFIQNVQQAATDLHIWDVINPDHETQPNVQSKPSLPTASTATGGNKASIASLDVGERDVFKLLYTSYQQEYAEWKQQDAALIAIHKHIREHITLPNHIAIAESTSVWNTLRLLKERNEPSDEAYKLGLQYEWSNLFIMDTRNQDWLVIIDKIRAVFGKIKKAKLPEAEGKLPMYHVINLLMRIDQAWADQRRAGLQQTGYYITDVPGLLNDFRTCMFTKPFRKPAGKGSYAYESNHDADNNTREPSFQGIGPDSKPKCPCGRDECRRPATCWYITRKPPPTWKPQPEVTNKVAKALKDPKIRSMVDRDRSAYANASKKDEEKKTTPKAQENEVSSTYQTSAHTLDSQDEETTVFTTFNTTGEETEPYFFTNAWVLDGGTERHVVNSPIRNNYTKTRDASDGAYVQTGLTRYPIESYGTCTLRVNTPDGGTTLINITDIALCPFFRTNLLSTHLLEEKGLHLIPLNGGFMCREDGKPLYIPSKHRSYWCLEYAPATHHPYSQDPRGEQDAEQAFEASSQLEQARKQHISKDPEDLWHLRLGHPGATILGHVPGAVQGDIGITYTPVTKECEVCSITKAHQLISRSSYKEHPAKGLFQRLNYDLIPLQTAYNGDNYISHFSCEYSSFQFVFTHRRKSDSVRCYIYVVNIILTHFGIRVLFFHTDGESSLGKEATEYNEFWDFSRSQGIIVEQSAPHTQDQNGGAEVHGKHIVIRMRALRNQSGQPHNMWPEHARTAVMLENKLPMDKLSWQTPYEVVYKTKPVISHLKVYGAKAYALHKTVPRSMKLDPRAFVGHLVGYEGTNIFRVWIPSQRKVIRTRDVTFDENDFIYDPSNIDSSILYPEAVENRLIIAQPRLEQQADADIIADMDLQGIEPPYEQADETHLPLADWAATGSKDADNPPAQLPTPSPTPSVEPHQPYTQTQEETDISRGDEVGKAGEGKGKLPHGGQWELTDAPPPKEISSEDVPILATRTRRGGKRSGVTGGSALYTTFESPRHRSNAFYAFITSTRQHRDDLPPPPDGYEQAKKHPLWTQLQEAMKVEIQNCEKRGVFEVVPNTSNITPKPIPLRWVYDYKFDSDGYLVRLKARLCVRGDKQPLNELETYAATLAAETMRFLLALAAYFDLEMRQYDAVTAFLNAELDEVIYTMLPPGFGAKELVWLLRRALYGLRRSPHLWHNELSGFLQSLGLEPVPGVNCIHHNDWLVVFFFVDDIICLYRKEDQERFNEFEGKLAGKYELRMMGEPHMFLGVEIQRDRSKRSLAISQTAYIDKITKRFERSLLPHPVYTPLPSKPLTSFDGQASDGQIQEAQEKVGSLGFAACITRADIALAASLLGEYLKNPSPEHIHAANHCLTYLRDTRKYAIVFVGGSPMQLIHISSDASFANDLRTRHSRQGYCFTMFDGLVAWKATKQRTVTTSSTEAELLAASFVGKEVIWWKSFFNEINFKLPEEISIKCDNTQTIRLLKEETPKLNTKLRHVDIHHHWLRQEVQAKKIQVEWIPTAEMPADGFTKPLSRQKHEHFVRLINMVNLDG
jgi:hypothetical protein